ncbi:MAG: hypothetical protein M1837_002954 [Sclerophora amabilis]|nr:MAG: hypothetical protein M1837_002954 [Sclerophora amabilis]
MDRGGRDRRFDDRDRPPPRAPYRPPPSSGRPPYGRGDASRSNRSPPPVKGRSSPPVDTYVPTNDRAPRPRSRSPGSFRRRSRSPPFRARARSPVAEQSWRTRERSPPPRWSPRRAAAPPRDERYVSPPPPAPPRSKFRSRSPLQAPRGRARSPADLTRGRDYVPAPVRARSPSDSIRSRDYVPAPIRSPPPIRRERPESPSIERYGNHRPPPQRPYSPVPSGRPVAPPSGPRGGPRGGFRERSRSPRRDDRYAMPSIDSRRPRSPSPPRNVRADYRSDHSSGNTSRRSSPPIHPSRMIRQHPAAVDPRPPSGWASADVRAPPRSAARSPLPSPYHARSPLPVERSPLDRDISPPPPPRRAYSPRPRSPPHGPAGYRSPPRVRDFSPPYREDEYFQEEDRPYITRNGYATTGTRRNQNGQAQDFASPTGMTPPVGPASTPMSMSAHNRPGNVSVLAAPRQPRGGPGAPPRRESSYSGPPGGGPRRGPSSSNYPPPVHSRGPPRGPPYSSRPTSPGPGGPGGVPTGPRTAHAPPPYRPSHNTTSKTYPLTQRFSRQLSDLPSIVPGGKLAPSGMDKSIGERLAKLQQEQEKLQKELAEKEEKKRKGLRTWDRLERESARDGLKSELAEQQVRMMAGEGGLGGAAF